MHECALCSADDSAHTHTFSSLELHNMDGISWILSMSDCITDCVRIAIRINCQHKLTIKLNKILLNGELKVLVRIYLTPFLTINELIELSSLSSSMECVHGHSFERNLNSEVLRILSLSFSHIFIGFAFRLVAFIFATKIFCTENLIFESNWLRRLRFIYIFSACKLFLSKSG